LGPRPLEAEEAVGEADEVLGDLLFGRELEQRAPLVAGLDQREAHRTGSARRSPDHGALQVLELDRAVGAVHDQRQPVAHPSSSAISRSLTTADRRRVRVREGSVARSKIERLSGL
jgi:hypothetical protein